MRIGSWFSRLFARKPVSQPAPKPPATMPTTPQPTRPVDVFEPSAPMRVSLGKVTGYTATEQTKLREATGLMEKVFNSREFRDAVLSSQHDGKPGFADDARSPKEIYEAIRAAKENFTEAADGEVDLNLSLKSLSWFNRNVVGYTTPSSDTITTNRRFFSNYDSAEVAGHLAHEWLHKLGFEHDHASTADRPHSVPYAVGDLVERLAKGTLTPL